MAKTKFVCQQCGYESPKWMGKCTNCGNWNCFEEETVVSTSISNKVNISNSKSTAKAYKLSEIDVNDEIRFHTGVSELDRVLGGGIVKGSVVLLGGDPGIGKSTLLMQICQYLGDSLSVMYISGEESARQLKLRADRLGVNTNNLQIIANTDVESIVSTIMQVKPDIVMIDSIQTMSIGSVTSSPGSIVQVRESTNVFLRVAKGEDIPIIIVGHVNKDGAIAGPKVLEHIVDTVLYFEGERNLSYRILRAVKNRFGSTNEIGVFEMQDVGLAEVENPSQMLLSGRPTDVSGICVACIMEGTRPILVEVQALVTKTGFGTPRRAANGYDYNRLNLILAVLEKRVGYFFSNLDTYINIIGGIRLDEPAADLAIAISLISSLTDKAVDCEVIAFGEIGLGGEVRSISGIHQRVKEAQRLGFTKAIVPQTCVSKLKDIDIEIVGVSNIKQAIGYIKK